MNTDLPDLVRLAHERARVAGFDYSCDPDVGQLLAVLATRVPEGGRIRGQRGRREQVTRLTHAAISALSLGESRSSASSGITRKPPIVVIGSVSRPTVTTSKPPGSRWWRPFRRWEIR
ncbi:hypothetical protein [Nonomuraea sp. NEAU-A123]|uniref:hypothetical protein n=1 Tax=Nonomuraea sp. NEAU-A123 TaxID=2839649 RepID=UPI001BE4D217|nr:hypothetical protein [Nonomuraea sp. NEAU-A123]MBT2234582.1 hypothetical protein [Nonomuraea sp. NEAU-A123]